MYNSQAARDTAHSLRNFTGAVRCIAATTNSPDLQRKIIHSGEFFALHLNYFSTISVSPQDKTCLRIRPNCWRNLTGAYTLLMLLQLYRKQRKMSMLPYNGRLDVCLDRKMLIMPSLTLLVSFASLFALYNIFIMLPTIKKIYFTLKLVKLIMEIILMTIISLNESPQQ